MPTRVNNAAVESATCWPSLGQTAQTFIRNVNRSSQKLQDYVAHFPATASFVRAVKEEFFRVHRAQPTLSDGSPSENLLQIAQQIQTKQNPIGPTFRVTVAPYPTT